MDVRDRVQQNFSEILKDITIYYTKKLDMLNIKLEHHQRTRLDSEHHELVHVRRRHLNNTRHCFGPFQTPPFLRVMLHIFFNQK